MYDFVDTHYQEKGNYASVSQLNNNTVQIQRTVANQFVQKQDVYAPDDGYSFGSSDITPIDDGQGSAEPGGNGVSSYKLVTLTTDAYQLLVDTHMVREDVYYFTYERGSDEGWHFGDAFPITLA